MIQERGSAEPPPQEDLDWAEALPQKIPPPTYAPAMLALAVVLILWGLIASWMISAVGGLLAATALAYWIKELLYD